MTIQADDHPLPPAEAVAAVCAVADAPYVHPPTRVTVQWRSVRPRFAVIADAVAGRLNLVGEFDLACGQQFRDASAAILAGDAAGVVVDLTCLRFIDASGIGILIELENALAVREATLRIVNADAQIGRIFSLCGLDAMLTGSAAPRSGRRHGTFRVNV